MFSHFFRNSTPLAGLRNQNGSAAITAVIMTLLVLGLVSQQFYDYFSARAKSQFSDSRFESRREALTTMLKRNVRSGIVLFASVMGSHKAENPGLYKCLFNEFGDDLNDCVVGESYPVAFYHDDQDPTGNEIMFTGKDPATAVCYEEDGTLAGPLGTCVFRVWTTFTPRCFDIVTYSNVTDFCNVASGLDITINIETMNPNGIARSARSLVSYAPIADVPHFGQWNFVAWDWRGPKTWDILWGIWFEGKPDDKPVCPGEPDCIYMPCINIDPNPANWTCGDQTASFGSTPGPMPPSAPPAGPTGPSLVASPCPSGEVYQGGTCVKFML